ncbi:YciI family protein [Micromonospora sp. NPDC094482]|uniref:YciI family protein n=1 Tax=unclassified Micromonospora TaxID=2617518 RepID=UPI00331BD333
MLIMRGTEATTKAAMASDLLDVLGRFKDDVIKAGVLIAAEALSDPAGGVVVHFTGDAPIVTSGPYAEARALFSGFYLLDVSSKEEAVEWAKRIPALPDLKCEVRQVLSLDEVF